MHALRLLLASAVAAALVAAVLAIGGATAADRPARATTQPSVRIAPLVVRRGQRITVTGRHWARNAIVELLIGPPRSEADRVGRARTTSSGTFRRHLRIGPRSALGRRVLLACRRECRVKAVKSFRVTR